MTVPLVFRCPEDGWSRIGEFLAVPPAAPDGCVVLCEYCLQLWGVSMDGGELVVSLTPIDDLPERVDHGVFVTRTEREQFAARRLMQMTHADRLRLTEDNPPEDVLVDRVIEVHTRVSNEASGAMQREMERARDSGSRLAPPPETDQ